MGVYDYLSNTTDDPTSYSPKRNKAIAAMRTRGNFESLGLDAAQAGVGYFKGRGDRLAARVPLVGPTMHAANDSLYRGMGVSRQQIPLHYDGQEGRAAFGFEPRTKDRAKIVAGWNGAPRAVIGHELGHAKNYTTYHEAYGKNQVQGFRAGSPDSRQYPNLDAPAAIGTIAGATLGPLRGAVAGTIGGGAHGLYRNWPMISEEANATARSNKYLDTTNTPPEIRDRERQLMQNYLGTYLSSSAVRPAVVGGLNGLTQRSMATHGLHNMSSHLKSLRKSLAAPQAPYGWQQNFTR